MHQHIIVLLLDGVFLSGLAWLVWTHLASQGVSQAENPAQRRGRQLKPHSPRDCPLCCAANGQSVERQKTIAPWSRHKSSRGRPKVVESDGYACMNPACPYYRITDGDVHALVSHGQHGKRERIQRWRCEACGQTATERLNTALYRLKTPSWRVAEVSTALAEGVDISAASRIFGHHERTIARWLERSGQHAQRLHEHFFVHLVCEHLQLDELVANVRGLSERVWIWVAIDARTKMVPVIHIGRRKHDDAQRFVHQIWQRLANGCLPVFTSDGLNHYFYALTAHFGHWTLQPGHRLPVWQVASGLRYGQLHKVKVGYRLKNLYTVALCGTRTQLREALQTLCLSGRIMTAYVERFNLTLRQLVAPLSRRTWSLACRESHLGWHIEWLRAYYHFTRPHQSLRLPTAHRQRYRSRTPAMAAGLTYRRWRVRELLLMPVCPA